MTDYEVDDNTAAVVDALDRLTAAVREIGQYLDYPIPDDPAPVPVAQTRTEFVAWLVEEPPFNERVIDRDGRVWGCFPATVSLPMGWSILFSGIPLLGVPISWDSLRRYYGPIRKATADDLRRTGVTPREDQ